MRAQRDDGEHVRDHRFALTLTGIVAVGVVLRVLYTLLLAPWPPPLGSDAWFYHYEADFLAQGRGFISVGYALLAVSRPSAAHPPLYPLVLAGLAKLGGTGQEAQRLAGTVFGAGTIVVVGLLGRRLVSERVGLIAAAIAAVYPMLITADGALLSESLYGLLIALSLLAVYRLLEVPSNRRAVSLGALLGLTVLTRGEALLLVPLMLVPFAHRSQTRRATAIAAVVLLAVLTPWTVRNWVVFHRPVPLSDNFASAVAGANCQSTYYGSKIGDWDNSCIKLYPGNEAQASTRAEHDGVEFALHHIARLPVVLAVRVARVWGLRRNLLPGSRLPHLEGRSPIVLEFGFLMYYVLVALGCYGTVLLRRLGVRVWPLAIMFVLVTAIAILTYGEIRFREPAEISLVALSAVAVERLWRRTAARRSGSAMAAPAESAPSGG